MIPLALLGLLLAVRNFEGFLFAMVCLVPLSVGITDVGGGLGLSIPDEPMLLIAAGGIVLLMLQKKINPIPFLLHPIGIVIVLQMLWAFVSSLNSTHGDISSKFMAARIVYILVFYIGFGTLFLNVGRIVQFFKAHLWGLIPLMLYAIIHLSQYGLSRKSSPIMADPFYDDHTLLGACLAMVLPWAGWLVLQEKAMGSPRRRRVFYGLLMALVVVTLILSFSRAAWISIVVIGGFYLILRFRIRFRYLLMALLLVAGTAWLTRDAIVSRMQDNENVSGEDVLTTAASVTNVSTDDSNKERVNRWACAVAMFEDRPLMGFGPGTYEREYGSYQVLSQMTRISTWAGDRGDAHSEYLGVLSEQGIPGLLFLGGLFLMSLHVGMRIAYHHPDPLKRGLAVAILLGLSTYYFHGFVNDFLDIDKAAVLFWGMMGMLAALEQNLPNFQNRAAG